MWGLDVLYGKGINSSHIERVATATAVHGIEYVLLGITASGWGLWGRWHLINCIKNGAVNLDSNFLIVIGGKVNFKS